MNLTAIVLAAGESRRMGTLKPLLPFGESTVIETVVKNLKSAGLDDILLVLGHEEDRIRASTASVNVEYVFNENYRMGMFSSVLAAVKSLGNRSESPDGVLICLADQPSIPPVVIRQLISEYEVSRDRIVLPVNNDRRGHPIVFPWQILSEATSFSGQDGLRGFRDRYVERLTRVPVEDESILIDLDTPAQYNQELIRKGLKR